MFAAVAAHGTIIGTAREIALIEFFRSLVPRRYEVLTGAIAVERDGRLDRSSSQLDVLVVDTFDYPTLLRAGDLAVVLAPSVLAVIESKSDLERGKDFKDAMIQIGRARQLSGQNTLTALFCFGAPSDSGTLRHWLEDILEQRRDHLKAAKTTNKTDREAQLTSATLFSTQSLPELILSDRGAIAIREDASDGSRTKYGFYKTSDGTPTIVALASKVLYRVSQRLPGHTGGQLPPQQPSYRLLMDHLDEKLMKSGDPDLDVTDEQPEPTE